VSIKHVVAVHAAFTLAGLTARYRKESLSIIFLVYFSCCQCHAICSLWNEDDRTPTKNAGMKFKSSNLKTRFHLQIWKPVFTKISFQIWTEYTELNRKDRQNQNQTFHYARRITTKRVTSLRCPSPRRSAKAAQLLA